jgi:hypothetical protein
VVAHSAVAAVVATAVVLLMSVAVVVAAVASVVAVVVTAVVAIAIRDRDIAVVTSIKSSRLYCTKAFYRSTVI